MKGQHKHPLLSGPYLLMGFLLLVWGSYAAIAKIALNDLDVWQYQFFSFGIGALALFIYMLAKKKLKLLLCLTRKQLIPVVIAGVISYEYYLLYSFALHFTSALEASILNYTFPVFILLLSFPINRERLTVKSVIAILVGLAGAAIVILGQPDSTPQRNRILGDILALCGAFCWGLFSNLGKRIKTDTETSNFIYVSTGFVLSAVGLAAFSAPLVPSLPAFTGVFLNGILSLMVGYTLWFRIVKRAPMALVASMSFITPFINLLFISLLLKESIHLQHILGLCVILIGLFIQNFKSKKEKSSVA